MRSIFLAVFLSMFCTYAFAHSPLNSTTPSDGAELSRAPESVVFSFKQNMRLTKVKWTHADKHSDEFSLEGKTSFATEFEFLFKDLGSGDYVIDWRGLGNDGHPQNGTFRFNVK